MNFYLFRLMNSLFFRNVRRLKFIYNLRNTRTLSATKVSENFKYFKPYYNDCPVKLLITKQNRQFSTSELKPDNISELEYERIVDETLDSLCEYFELIGDTLDVGKEYDVNYSQGVLTVKFAGGKTYVINKQTPNKQIWLSSPISGPKRYDFVKKRWIYLHDGVCLHDLLYEEIKSTLKNNNIPNFSNCKYA